MRVKGSWQILDDDGPGDGDHDGGDTGNSGNSGNNGDPGNSGADAGANDVGGADGNDPMDTGGGVSLEGGIHGVSVINVRDAVETTNTRGDSGSPSDGAQDWGGWDGNIGLSSQPAHEQYRSESHDSTNDHWGFGANYGETGFVSLGPVVIGGSVGGGAAQYSGPTEVNAGVFVGAVGIAYAVSLTPSATVSYRSSSPAPGLTVSCDPALMLVTPIFDVMASFPKSTINGTHGLDVTISIGLTLGAGVVGGVYCGGAIDSPPFVNTLRKEIDQFLP